jgi:outer membrane protein assembly factor BamB
LGDFLRRDFSLGIGDGLLRPSSTAAYEIDGTLAWAKPMDAKNTGNDGYFYGGGASPALHDGRIYIVNDNEEASFAAAFDTRTGTELWRVARDERSNWSIPYVWQNNLRTEIVTVGSRRVRSYDVNGTLLWELAVGTTLHTPTPFASNGLLYVSSGKRQRLRSNGSIESDSAN